MNKKAYAFFLKKNRKRKKPNPVAKALKFFTPKVIRDKKKYRRQDGRIWKRKIWSWTGD
jgi:hypothetical protein